MNIIMEEDEENQRCHDDVQQVVTPLLPVQPVQKMGQDSIEASASSAPTTMTMTTTMTTSSVVSSAAASNMMPNTVKVCSVTDEVITRGKRSGSLSKFVDENDLYRRKSLHGSSSSGGSSSNSAGNGSLEELMASLIMEDDPLSTLTMVCALDTDDDKDKQLQQDHAKSVANFLAMPIDSILEILDDKDSELRHWLLQPEIVHEILTVFIRAPCFELAENEEPNEEYGFYKDYFTCSEIIMKLYTGEDDLYGSFSSDSSDGSNSSTGNNSTRSSLHGGRPSVQNGSSGAVFGCQNDDELERWRLLFSLFDDPKRTPLDEMQLLFYSKVIVRLHDCFCLEDGYVQNVLTPLLPKAIGHLYSNTIKFMLVLILQSYESVHPITGRNDAMEILAPVLARSTRLEFEPTTGEIDAQETHWRFTLVENAATLLVDMLQANQADRLGSFVRKECGVMLSKYFVRDQFGTIRGFESVHHGYHNFLQFMLVEELGKNPAMIGILFENALFELQEWSGWLHNSPNNCLPVSSMLNVATTCEMMSLFLRIQDKNSGIVTGDELGNKAVTGEASTNPMEVTDFNALGLGIGGAGVPSSYFPSDASSGNNVMLYDLKTCVQLESFCQGVVEFARATAGQFVQLFHQKLGTTIQIALAKHLHSLVLLNDPQVNEILHQQGLASAYFKWLCEKPRCDMLHVHVLPAMVFILKDQDMTRDKDCPLTRDLVVGNENHTPSSNQQDDEHTGAPATTSKPIMGVLSFIVHAFESRSQCRIHATLLHQTISEIFDSEFPSENNVQVVDFCMAHGAYRAFRDEALKKRKCRAAAEEDDEEDTDVSVLNAIGGGSFKELCELESSNQLQEQNERELSILEKAVQEDSEQHTQQQNHGVEETSRHERKSLKAGSQERAAEDNNNDSNDKADEVDNNAKLQEDSMTQSMTSPLPPPQTLPSEDNSRRGYFRSMLNPIRKNSFRNSPKSQENQPQTQTSQPQQHTPEQNHRLSTPLSTPTTEEPLSSKWRHVFKRIKNSVTLATGGASSSPSSSSSSSKAFASGSTCSKKPLALSGSFTNSNELLVVDTTRGDDITNFVYHNGGVHVAKVVSSRTQKPNTVTSGYMYRNRMPELGHRHSWERLYFVLDREQGTLCYYASETHARDRIFVRGTVRPTSVSEGIPVAATGQHTVFGLQITTQGHGVFWVLVESEDTRSSWFNELLHAISAWTDAQHQQQQQQRRENAPPKPTLDADATSSVVTSDCKSCESVVEPNPVIAVPSSSNALMKMNRTEMKQLVVELYVQLYGPQMRFTTPLEAPGSQWLNNAKAPLSCMADTVVLSSNLPECVPYWGEFHGYDRVCDYFRIRDETIEKSSGRVLRIVVDDAEETIVVMTTTTYRILRNSEVVTEESCDVITVSNGQIVSIHCTFDSFTIAEAFMREGLNAS